MATAIRPNVRRGFHCACIHCGEKDGIRLLLDDVTGVDVQFSCAACEAEFSLGDVKDVIGAWQKAITWLESAPEFSGEE